MDHGEREEGGARHLMARLSELGVDFEHWCFACGRLNENGLHLDFDVSRGRAMTTFVPERRHQGYDGTVHGGIVAALLDETMGWAIFHEGVWGVTARLNVAFRQPVAVGDELRIVGEVVRERSRSIETHGTVSRASDGAALAEADATFLLMPEERRRELEVRYSRTAETFARVRAAVDAEERVREHGRT
jgi:uncharacterized protein (TIGR00369 family)